MKNRIQFLYILLAVGLIFTTACQKDEDLSNPNPSTEKTLEELEAEFLEKMGPDYDKEAWKAEWFRPDAPSSGNKRVKAPYPFSQEPKFVEAEVIDGMVVLGGDMVLGTEAEVDRMNNKAEPRGVIRDGHSRRWEYATIPVKDYSSHPNSARIADAIRQVDEQTNLTIVPHTNQGKYVEFFNSADGNYVTGYPGAPSGSRKSVYITPNAPTGTIMHELLHVAGMYHEQARCDRDDHIDIHWDNIDSDWHDQFYKKCYNATDVYSYDYHSIMHYHPYAASKNGYASITPRYTWPWEYFTRMAAMGQREQLSEADINTVNHLYPIHTNQSQTYSLLQVYPAQVGQGRLALEARGANQLLIVNTWRGHTPQRFRFIPTTGGYYAIQDLQSGQVLTVTGASTGDNAQVQLRPRQNGAAHQEFRLRPVTWGSYTLVARHSGKEISSQMRIAGAGMVQNPDSHNGWFQIFPN